jgi:uncharacterized protein (TIGR02145 family)
MKKIFTLFAGIMLCVSVLNAQAPPQAFSFKATIKDSRGLTVPSRTIRLRISILKSNTNGFVSYSEYFTPTTDINSQVDLQIGRGNVLTGIFSSIDWSSDVYFLKIEVDVRGGTNYQLISVTQLLSVPYALYAAKAGNNFSGYYNDLKNKPTLFDGTWASLSGKPSFASVAYSGRYNDLTNKPTLFSGNYNDLTNKPAIDGSETKIQAGNNVTVTGTGTTVNPYRINSTNGSVPGNNPGDMLYWNGSTWVIVPVGSNGQVLTINNGVPTWGSVATTVTDIDGNVYETKTIGTQIWMTENLKTSKYNNGIPILNVTDNTEWRGLTSGAYCWYNHDAATYKDVYGALYNWYTVTTGTLCPKGWHVPSETEWTTLVTFLGGESVAGGKLKEAGTIHWNSPNAGANNESGFNALPGGYYHNSGSFNNIGDWGTWWSSSEYIANYCSWYRRIDNSSGSVSKAYSTWPAGDGYSVRCLQGEGQIIPTVTTGIITSILKTTATSGGNITNNGGTAIYTGGVCWNTSPNPTIANYKTSDITGTGSFSSSLAGLTLGTKYYVRAYATNSTGTWYGDEITFTTVDIDVIIFNPELTYGSVNDNDGNTYKTIQIGAQTWMAENLKTTKYSDGTTIPLVTDITTWVSSTAPGYCWYNNDEATYKNAYGALYNWYVVDRVTNGGKNVCPTGWHVPIETEWTTLVTFLGGESVAGGKLKEAGTIHWLSPNTNATNEIGFTALSGGYRHFSGAYNNIGFWGAWWSSVEYSATYSWYRRLDNVTGITYTAYSTWGVGSGSGFSIRCLKD